MNHGNAIFQSFFGVLEIDFLTFQINVSFVLVIYAEEAFHQSGLCSAL